MSDFTAGTVEEARGAIRALGLATAPDAVSGAREAAEGAPAQKGRARRVILTPASEITPERLRWLWAQRVVLRGLSVIAGEPGLGKSTLTVELAADVTDGRLEGDLHGEPHDVLIATAEDHFASVVWGRLTAAGADMNRIHRITVEDRDGEDLLTIPDDVAQIEQRCAELAAAGRPVGLVVVDPVAAFIGGGTDTHRDAAVRRVLTPLAQLAERQHLAVLAVAHLNKDTAGKLLARVGGSIAFGAAPRSVLAFARHPEDPGGDQGIERVIVAAKSNHGQYAPSLAARIEGREVEAVGSVSRLVITGECEIGADDLGAQTGGDHHDRDAAAEWLADELADGQWHESRSLKARAKDADHSERTLKRAKQALGVEDRREGFQAVSEWRLAVGPPPSQATGPTELGPTSPTRTLEPNTGDPAPSWATSPGGGPTEPDGLADDCTCTTLAPAGDGTCRRCGGPIRRRDRSASCTCTRPARSPRATGPDQCTNCKRPMSALEAVA
jgi:RecA-family ATPase